MAKCKQCGKEYEAKRSTSKYCDDACRLVAFKNAKEINEKRNAKKQQVETLNKCQYCGKDLPALENPRKFPGTCLDCAIKQPAKASHRLDPRFTGTMPGMDTSSHQPVSFGLENCECGHCQAVKNSGSHHTLNHGPYKTATQLSPSELNRVPLPGDVDYVPAGSPSLANHIPLPCDKEPSQ